jgi:steroid delta-isomerase-like uncharacterized protein
VVNDAVKAADGRHADEVQGRGDFDVFDQLFAGDFVDRTTPPGFTPGRDGARGLYHALRAAFPDFRAEVHRQAADGELVVTYTTYRGTHRGSFLGLAPTGRRVHFKSVDVMRVRDGRVVEHWGVANFSSLMRQLGAWPAAASE